MDKASKDRLAKVHPELARRIERTIAALATKGYDVRVVQGLRTYAEQDALYSQGRTRKGAKVTNARGGFSNHNFSLAVDLCPFKGGKPDWSDDKGFNAIGAAGKKEALFWGGDWHSLVDKPHLELPTKLTIKQCRDLFAKGGLNEVWKVASINLGLSAPVKLAETDSTALASNPTNLEPTFSDNDMSVTANNNAVEQFETVAPTGNAPASIVAVSTPVIEVEQVSAAVDQPKDEPKEDVITRFSNRLLAIPAAALAAVGAAATWATSAPLNLVISLIAVGGVIVAVYMIVNSIRNAGKEKRALIEKNEREKREMELKAERERQAFELQKLTMQSAMNKDFNTIRIVPPATEMPNSDEKPEVIS